jgi:pimeloyl-ACP methyl ester carboxylesterase
MFDLLTSEWFDGLPDTSVPTSILWGDRDRILQPSQADDLARRLRHGERRIIEGWGHYPMIEQPADYATVVAEIAARLVQGS